MFALPLFFYIMAQCGVTMPAKFMYFPIRGALSGTILCLEIAGADYEFEGVPMEKWPELKATMPTGKLPVMVMASGDIIPESNAIRHAAAASCGMLGEGDDFLRSEMLLGMCQDISDAMMKKAPTMFNVATWTAEDTKTLEEDVRPKIVALLEGVAKMLKGDKFTEKTTLGEAQLYFLLTQLEMPHPGIASALDAFKARMAGLDGVKKWEAGETKMGAVPHYVMPVP